MISIPGWAIGLAVGIGIAAVARRVGALSPSGGVAAIVLGTVASAAGLSWAALLVAYFVAGVLVTRWKRAEKQARVGSRVEKGGPRDASQVMANGGMFGVAALAYVVQPNDVGQALAAGALAASTADTWATEIGTIAGGEPRSLAGFSPVPPGTSGGITIAGTLASVAGAALVAGIVSAMRWPAFAVVSAFAGGVLGSALDSVLGAFLQTRRNCPTCNEATEQRLHHCGSPTDVVGGLRLLDNDAVNVWCTFGGAVLGAGVATMLGY